MILFFEEYINEKFINIIDKEKKEAYLDEVWAILELSYSYLGGIKGNTKENIIQNSGLWKLIKDNGKIVAAYIYKKSPSNDYEDRKGILIGSDGSEIGKKWLKKIIDEDILFDRSWGEVSGKLEVLMQRLGYKFNSNKYAKILFKDKQIELDSDGIHYYRDIDGVKIKKALVGNLDKVLKSRGENL